MSFARVNFLVCRLIRLIVVQWGKMGSILPPVAGFSSYWRKHCSRSEVFFPSLSTRGNNESFPHSETTETSHTKVRFMLYWKYFLNSIFDFSRNKASRMETNWLLIISLTKRHTRLSRCDLQCGKGVKTDLLHFCTKHCNAVVYWVNYKCLVCINEENHIASTKYCESGIRIMMQQLLTTLK